MKRTILLSLAVLLAITFSHAQKLMLEKGDPDVIQSEKVFNVEYKYDNLKVGKMTEEAYIEKRMAEKEKAEPGSGETWKEAWFNDRSSRFEPKFEELFNKTLEKRGVSVGVNPDAKYTMVVHTVFIEPGYNIGISRSSAYVSQNITFVETESGNEIATYSITKAPGGDALGYDFDSGYRISEGFAVCGKRFAALLYKEYYK